MHPPTQFPLILEFAGEVFPETWSESVPAVDSCTVGVSLPLTFCSWDDPADAGCFFAFSEQPPEQPETSRKKKESIKEMSKFFISTWGRIFFLQSIPQEYFSQLDSPGTTNPTPPVKRL